MRSSLIAAGIALLSGAAAAQQPPPSPPTVLFVCERGTVKSVVAAEIFNRIASDRGLALRAEYRGVTPDAEIPGPVRRGLEADGLTVSFVPKRFAVTDTAGVARVVAFDQPVVASTVGDGRVTEWNGLPAFSDGYDPARAAIEVKVRDLIETLSRTAVDGRHAAHTAAARAFVAAFNARAIDDMLALTTDDVEWVSVDGATTKVEAAGREALGASLAAYFKSCATCRSEIEVTGGTTTRLAAVETASWQTAKGPRSRRSLSVYEFRDGKIRRVSYYPAEE